MSTRLKLLPFAVLAALTLVVSSCGGSDESSSTTTTTEKKAESSDDKDETTTTEADASGGGSTAGLSPECADLQEAFTSLDVQGMTAAFTDGSNPGPQFQNFADALDTAQENAPEEISGDLATLSDGYQQLADSADEIDWSAIQSGDAEASAAASELMQGFSSEDLAGAGQRVSDWLNENCIPS